MPDEPLVIPVAGQGVETMAEVTTGGVGIDDVCLGLLLDSAMETHEGLMAEIAANSETAAEIVRVSAARKFNREDPIEAAAAETILKIKP